MYIDPFFMLTTNWIYFYGKQTSSCDMGSGIGWIRDLTWRLGLTTKVRGTTKQQNTLSASKCSLYLHAVFYDISHGGSTAKLAVMHITSTYSNGTKEADGSARLAQSVEHETLNLRVVGSSPTLGVNF